MKKKNFDFEIQLRKKVLIPLFLLGFFLIGSVGLNAQSYLPADKAANLVNKHKKEFYADNPVLNTRYEALPASALDVRIAAEFLERFTEEIYTLKTVPATLNAVATFLIEERDYSATTVNTVKQQLDTLLQL